jgi:fatty acid-binding protein DegV
MPTTSQVNVEEYLDFFELYLREDKDIFHVSLSTGLSGEYNSACFARDELLQKYPKRKMRIVDSLR